MTTIHEVERRKRLTVLTVRKEIDRARRLYAAGKIREGALLVSAILKDIEYLRVRYLQEIVGQTKALNEALNQLAEITREPL